MYYYEALVSEYRYQQRSLLTYQSDTSLKSGSIVSVPYGKKTVPAIIITKVQKPYFPTKAIVDQLSEISVPNDFLQLFDWLKDYYPYGYGPIAKLFLPNYANYANNSSISNNISTTNNPKMTKDQTSAVSQILSSDNSSFLIHGETGTGKTRIYTELAIEAVKRQKSVIILVPEISLVEQTYTTFAKIFHDSVLQMHSALSKKEHRLAWTKIYNTHSPVVVIGTRSAIFAPTKNLGLVIVDEMHEASYKQDSSPRYNALRVAAKRASINKAKIVYGSATPSISDYYLAKKTHTPIIRITNKALPTQKVDNVIVDIKNKQNFTKNDFLSDILLNKITNSLTKKEQRLVFLNRRGTAKQTLCNQCGWQSLCPRCDIPLTLHSDQYKNRCHVCGYSSKPPLRCPDCDSVDIISRSPGTKAITEALVRLYPEARIQRFDTDNLASEKISLHYKAIQSGDIDILVGTQMLGKGLDLPRLSVVGIVNADTSLSMPDFSSTEKNYQMIHQAVGRVGRGHTNGSVVLQTLRPDSSILSAAMQQNWHKLYATEITERQRFNFPPFVFMMIISASRNTDTSAEAYLKKLVVTITKMNHKATVSDPTPSFYAKSNSQHNWHIIIRSSNRNTLTNIMTALPAGNHTIDIDPLNLL